MEINQISVILTLKDKIITTITFAEYIDNILTLAAGKNIVYKTLGGIFVYLYAS